MYCAALIQEGAQSATLKSYISAIKAILRDDGYEWNENRVLLGSLTRSCKLINDRVRTRLPVNQGLLEMMLFELERLLSNQPFLMILYKAMFALAYYGLFRAGEITKSNHVIKAANVHIGQNKDKLLIILYTSKTHGLGSFPQKVKIEANHRARMVSRRRFFCPFKLMRDYLKIRGDYTSDCEQLFVFSSGAAVEAVQLRNIFKEIILRLGLDNRLYGLHSFRIGHASDMVKTGYYSLEQVKSAGRWRSSAVYRYIKN